MISKDGKALVGFIIDFIINIKLLSDQPGLCQNSSIFVLYLVVECHPHSAAGEWRASACERSQRTLTFWSKIVSASQLKKECLVFGQIMLLVTSY